MCVWRQREAEYVCCVYDGVPEGGGVIVRAGIEGKQGGNLNPSYIVFVLVLISLFMFVIVCTRHSLSWSDI